MDQTLAGERDSYGKIITQTLNRAGITLEADDALKFSIGKDGAIVVDANGLSKKNKNNAKAIESALNGIPGLAKELYYNSAAQSLNNAQKKVHNATTPYALGSDSASEAAAQRVCVDEWLQSTVGISIDELEAESAEQVYGEASETFLSYIHSELGFTEGTHLKQATSNILNNAQTHGDAAREYQAAFTFQNGILTDDKNETANADHPIVSETAASLAEDINQAQKELQTQSNGVSGQKVDDKEDGPDSAPATKTSAARHVFAAAVGMQGYSSKGMVSGWERYL